MKSVLITGCSSGFGKELVEFLSQKGFLIFATMRNSIDRNTIFDHLPDSAKKNIKIINLDVTKKEDIKAAVDMISKETNNSLDILINNAGFALYGALEELTEEQIRYQMEVNFFGPILMIKNFLPLLKVSKGKVINISSYMGQFSMPFGSIYSASKFSLEGLSEGLYYELNSVGVQLTSILPGGHRTGFISAIDWSPANVVETDYSNQIKALNKIIKKVDSGKLAPKSNNMSHLIIKILSQKRISRKYYLGKDAFFGNLFQSLVPRKIYYPLLSFIYRKLLNSNT